MAQNTTLTYLNLHGNNIGDDDEITITEALKTNTTLTNLNLRGNNIGDKRLETNKTITSVDLFNNLHNKYVSVEATFKELINYFLRKKRISY